ncbi:hypothetical protein P170DRAFT_409980 [Aspergillus steynii IBT 23096]|uniref:Xylanolytic transcriptional activator regulatory domain-containing protein n=1 Tax=Aspergillus steynii IBT 23096 TaxID=1392250 RepID=A0A2I2G4D4_9EURO|nr:uncharacterized protein P170DRAFT_409980 [Aspergillus steynii IBT 23096]PLB47723.1 hypothetical protein P170DRAFT_409980 [Aspergillus steynii IBT 23096]
MPFFSPGGREWVQARTGTDIVFPGSLSKMPRLNYLVDKSPITMPDRAVLDNRLTMFKSSMFRQLFPLLEAEIFRTTIYMAYSQSHSPMPLNIMSAKMSVFAFMAYTSSLFPGAKEAENGDFYALEAQRLLSDLVHHPATIDGLQTALLLILYRQSTFGDLPSVDALISTASRFVYSLGGHISPGSLHNPPSRHEWHCRNLFWICHNIDRKLCLRTGRPPCINDSCCDLSLPEHYIDSIKRELPPSPGYSEPIFLIDIRLSLIESHIFVELYAPPARGKSDAELLRTIRNLDTMVEEWKVLALKDDRETLPFEQKQAHDSPDLQTAVLNMQYLYSVATIHQATTGCRAWIEDQGCTMEGVNSSLLISVEASRQLLRLINTLPASSLEGGFWFSLFFFLSAGVVLFCNILNSPDSPNTQGDILILDALAAHIQEGSGRRASPQAQPKIDNAGQFAAELGKLARCAVRKAQMYRQSY